MTINSCASQIFFAFYLPQFFIIPMQMKIRLNSDIHIPKKQSFMLLVCLYSQDVISAWLEEFRSDYPKLRPIGILSYGDCSS